jgi:hypothetical protein
MTPKIRSGPGSQPQPSFIMPDDFSAHVVGAHISP